MRRLLCFVLAAGSLSCRASTTTSGSGGYWSVSCVSGDGRYLLAGGDHAALVDASTGDVVERVPGMVKAVGCDRTGGIVVGYLGAFRIPGRTTTPVPAIGGDTVLAKDPGGAWISSGRTTSGGKWRGPASVYVTRGDRTESTDLLPSRFGSVGAARPLPFPDSFAVRFGNLMEDGRLLLAAGWQPSRSGSTVEGLPWGFFAWDLSAGVASPLTAPLASDAAINQAWFQRIAASRDGAHLVVAVHDGERVSIGRYERDANRPARVIALAAKGGPSAVALSDDGTFVAVATETRGREAPAQAWVIDAEGKTVWNGSFEKNVAGMHFLPDGSLLVAAGEAKAVRVPLR